MLYMSMYSQRCVRRGTTQRKRMDIEALVQEKGAEMAATQDFCQKELNSGFMYYRARTDPRGVLGGCYGRRRG